MSIVLESVTKKYGDFKAVDDVSLEMKDKNITVLIGTSGSGKTTLMRMINRLIERSSGKIMINGNDINDVDPIELRRSIGYVIQSIGLFPHMTVYDNIAIVPRLLEWKEKKIKDKIYELLELVNLPPEYADKYPSQISGGQKQRVGVARGLAADPEILLMDEPFGAIDPINRENLQESFLDIQDKIRKTIVFVTHDIREAVKLGDYIAIMNEGKIEQYGKTEEVVKNPVNEFVRDILGSHMDFKFLEMVKVFGNYSDKIEKVLYSTGSNEKFYSTFDRVVFHDTKGFFSGIMNKNGNIVQDGYIFDHENMLSAINKMLQTGTSHLAVINKNKTVLGMLRFEEILKV